MRVRVERRDSHRGPNQALDVAGLGVARRGVLAGMLLFAVLGLVSCGSENPGTVARSTTTTSTSIVIDPSTIPAGDIAACQLLADTVGLDGLVPIDSSSWRDERERILVDAQRESTLLRLAVRGASPELAPALETLATHADRVAEEISQATSYTDAMSRLESTGMDAELPAAADAVDAWRGTNC